MMTITPGGVLLRAAVTGLCLTVTVGAFRPGANGVDRGSTASIAESDGWQIPDAAATERNPVPSDSAVLARGQAIYRSKCQGCHGVNGTGDGPYRDANHPPANLSDAHRASRNPDGVMFYKIWNGRSNPRMPAMKTDLSRADVWAVIHFVKTLRRGDAAIRPL
jgi:mono/diheme cytochrome c family protein